MKKYKIVYLSVAKRDLMEIVEYIKKDKQTAAIEFIEQIDTSISQLECFSEMGKVPQDLRLRRFNYKVLIVGNYLVFYVIRKNVIEIRRILHGKRRYDFLF